jgi:hypothetical protein
VKPFTTKTAAFLLAAGLALSAGCTETFELVWRNRISEPVAKELPAPNFRLTIVEWPSQSNPVVIAKVERQKFWIQTAEKIRKQFKKFDDGRFIPVQPPREERTPLARVSGKSAWVPAPGMNVVFRVSGEETPVPTDEKGLAVFDVTPFAELWIEGRELQVEVQATLQTILDAEPFKKAKGKDPRVLKSLKVQKQPQSDAVGVDVRTLEKIFEGR